MLCYIMLLEVKEVKGYPIDLDTPFRGPWYVAPRRLGVRHHDPPSDSVSVSKKNALLVRTTVVSE